MEGKEVVWKFGERNGTQLLKRNISLTFVITGVNIINGVFGNEEDSFLHLVPLIDLDNDIRKDDILVV